MAKNDKLKNMMANRSPLSPTQRVIVEPENPYKVDEKVFDTDGTTPPTPVANNPSRTQDNISVIPNERTVIPNGYTERFNNTDKHITSVLQELADGINDDRRATERYSFEIFIDQKQLIEDLQYQYKRKTGKKLSASRIIREALETYLTEALQRLK
jgi:hypothetical protein